MIKSFIALDLETTGINPKIDRIIEIGMARIIDFSVVEKREYLIYPGIKLDDRITELTGITDDDLKGKPRINEVISEVIDFIGDGPILGHNIIFDYSFLKKAAVNEGLTVCDKGIDTLKIARRLLPELEHKNLTALCEYYNVDPHRSHRAYDDAISAFVIYQKLMQLNPEDSGFNSPIQLVYNVKKDSPITAKQISYLEALLKRHQIEPDIPVCEMTKSMASRQIDKIIAQYGK